LHYPLSLEQQRGELYDIMACENHFNFATQISFP
jgi:hypothetical protein